MLECNLFMYRKMIYLTIEDIYTFEQFWKVLPEVSVLYLDFNSLIVCKQCKIISSDIVRLSTPPSSLLRLDLENAVLIPLIGQVK